VERIAYYRGRNAAAGVRRMQSTISKSGVFARAGQVHS